jgi:phosphoglycolate phosphatase
MSCVVAPDMPLPRPSAVIFDMDGTTVRHLNPRLLNVLERLDDIYYALRHGIAQIMVTLGLSRSMPWRRSTRKPRLIVHRTMHKMRRKPVEEIVEPCAGIIDLLELLKAHRIPVGLVSNGLGQGYGHDILKQFGLESLFTASVFREDIIKSKPDPEAILTMLKKLHPHMGVNDIVWYVGDRKKDITAALSANYKGGPKVIPIGYGLHAAMSAFEHGLTNDQLVFSYEEWYPIVENLLTLKA